MIIETKKPKDLLFNFLEGKSERHSVALNLDLRRRCRKRIGFRSCESMTNSHCATTQVGDEEKKKKGSSVDIKSWGEPRT